jgi:hypothetical protein
MTKKQIQALEPSIELEALSDIYLLASRTRQLYEDMLTDSTKDEAYIAALLHAIEALADKAIR